MEIISEPKPEMMRVRDVEVLCTHGVKHELVLWPQDKIDYGHPDFLVIEVVTRPIIVEGRDLGHKGSVYSIARQHIIAVTVTERDVVVPGSPDAAQDPEA